MIKIEKPITEKKKTIRGEFGAVETETGLYKGYPNLGIFEFQQTIKRFEPKKAKNNLSFMAYYFRNKDNRIGGLHFFPRLYSAKEWVHHLTNWNFQLEFDYDTPDGFACRMTMTSAQLFSPIIEDIDIETCCLLMTKFFEACNPHCQYDFNDVFIEVFKNSRYKKLRQYARHSKHDYEFYIKGVKISEPQKARILSKRKKY